MSLRDYLIHYLNLRPALLMLVTAAGAVLFSVSLIRLFFRKQTPAATRAAAEQFYELIFSATTILLFTGTYFLIDFLGFGRGNPLWLNYSDFILLGFIFGSVLLTSALDHFLIPLKRIQSGARSTMRLLGMLYMLIVFAYVKFIYQNDNYDRIILYFLTLVIGRFVYFDASVEGFAQAVSDAVRAVPLLLLALLCSGLIAYTGFTTGYLLHQNGVIFNLFIGHLYLLAVIFVLHWITLFTGFLGKLKKRKPDAEAELISDENSVYSDKEI